MPEAASVPVFDSTQIHVEAALDLAAGAAAGAGEPITHGPRPRPSGR